MSDTIDRACDGPEEEQAIPDKIETDLIGDLNMRSYKNNMEEDNIGDIKWNLLMS